MRPTIDDLKTREDLGRSVDVEDELERAKREWPEKALKRAAAFKAVTTPVCDRKLPCPRCGGGPGQLVRPCACKLTGRADASGKLERAT